MIENVSDRLLGIINEIKQQLQLTNGAVAAIVEIAAIFIAKTALEQNALATVALGLAFFLTYFISRYQTNAPIIEVKIFKISKNMLLGFVLMLAITAPFFGIYNGMAVVAGTFVLIYIILSFFDGIPGGISGNTKQNEKTTIKDYQEVGAIFYYLDIAFALALRLGMSLGLAAVILNWTGIINIQSTIDSGNLVLGSVVVLAIGLLFDKWFPNKKGTPQVILLIYLVLVYLGLVSIGILKPVIPIVTSIENIVKSAGWLGLGLIEIYLAVLLFYGRRKKEETTPDQSVLKNIAQRKRNEKSLKN